MCVCTHLLLCGNGELVAGNEAGHLLHPQIEELFTPNDFSEMLFCGDKNTGDFSPLSHIPDKSINTGLSTINTGLSLLKVQTSVGVFDPLSIFDAWLGFHTADQPIY